MGLFCLQSLPCEYIACGGGWVVLWCQKLATGCAVFGVFQKVQVKVSHHLCPAQGHLALATEPSADGYYLC